jgi:hypothetical protein
LARGIWPPSRKPNAVLEFIPIRRLLGKLLKMLTRAVGLRIGVTAGVLTDQVDPSRNKCAETTIQHPPRLIGEAARFQSPN